MDGNSSIASIPIRDGSLSTEINSNIRDAVERYQEKVTTMNRNFLKDRIADINERYPNASERKKLDIMARFWFHETEWPKDRLARGWDPPGDLKNQVRQEDAVTTLEEVANLYHRYIDGTGSPSLQSQQEVDAVADAFEEVAREKCEADGDGNNEGLDFKLPSDMKEFIQYADGLHDPDFRYEGMCGWSIVPMMDLGWSKNRTDTTAIKNMAKENIQALSIEIPDSGSGGWFPYESLSDFLEMKVVIACGEASRQDYNKWCSWYVYCRRLDDDDDGNDEDEERNRDDKGWRWRVVFWDHTYYHRVTTDDDDEDYPPIFDTLTDLLDWYSNWDEKLDVNVLKTDMLDDKDEISNLFMTVDGIYSESESEGEIYTGRRKLV